MFNSSNNSLHSEGRYKYWLILLLILAYFPLFLHLDSLPLRIWDESLFALRAYNLAEHGTYLENFNQFEAGPDHANVKPPLFTVVQALSFKFFGYNLLALRLPVALCAMATVLLLFRFSIKEFGSPVMGLFSAMVLLTSRGYVQWHMSRTGDHDAVLALLTTAAVLAFYKSLKTDPPGGRNLFFSCLALTAATLVKSVMALIIIPGMMVYALYRGQFTATLRKKQFYAGVAFFFMAVGGTALWLALQHPEWAQNIWSAELGGRYSNVIDRHAHPFFFYLSIMEDWAFTPWLFVLPLSIWLSFRPVFAPFRDVIVLLTTVSLSILLVISTSQTKIEWYAASLYPLFALMAGFSFWAIWKSLSEFAGLQRNAFRTSAALLLMFFLFYKPYSHNVDKVMRSDDYQVAEQYGPLMQKLEREKPNLKSYHIIHHGWNTHTLFYKTLFNEKKGYRIDRMWNAADLKTGDYLMYAQWGVENQLDSMFRINEVARQGECRLVQIGPPVP